MFKKELSQRVCTFGLVFLGIIMAILALLLPLPEVGLSVVIIFCLLIIFVKIDMLTMEIRSMVTKEKEEK